MRDLVEVIRENAALLLEDGTQDLTDRQGKLIADILDRATDLGHEIETMIPRMSPCAPSVRDASPPTGGSELPSVLLAEDDNDVLDALVELLSPAHHVTVARDGEQARTALLGRAFDLAILDVGLPILDGFQLIKALRDEGHQPSTFMFLSAQAELRTKVHALSLGAVDYVTKPFEPDELLARIQGILAAATREAVLRADARTDPLTGLGNYKSLAENLDRELERSSRYGSAISLITIDVDNLKLINDQYGHEAGNDAIRLVANALARGVRRFEVVARQGGDEFAIILPNTACNEALRLAERLRAEIGKHTVQGLHLSVSIGGASWEHGGSITPAVLMKASDEALYRAKRAGRDRAEVRCLTADRQ